MKKFMSCGDQIEHLVTVDLPISVRDLTQIEAMLRDEGPFCSSFPDEDMYSAALYHREAAIPNSEFRLVVDRNVFVRIVQLAGGALATQEHRIPAAVMAFAQCAGIEIEPNLALHEGVASQARKVAVNDLALFRAVDNLHPSEFGDIALGRATGFCSKLVVGSEDTNLAELAKPIKQFAFVYPSVLKIGLIELAGGPMDSRIVFSELDPRKLVH